MVNRLGGVNGMDYSQGLPTPNGTGDLLGDLIPEGKSGATIGLIASVLVAAAGIYISIKSYKQAPMPSSLKKVFRTDVKWYEPDVPLFAVGSALEAGGVIGLIVSINRLMAKD